MRKIEHRHFRMETDDFKNMAELLTALYGKGEHDWTLGRLYAWKYGLWSEEARNPEIFAKSAELFFDENSRLQGFIILEECGGDLATLFLPEDKALLKEMICFLDNGGNFNHGYSIYCCQNKSWQIDFLKSYGYDHIKLEDLTFEYCAEDIMLPCIKMPAGYKITDQSVYTAIEKIEKFRFTAFNPNAKLTEDIVWAYKYSRENPFIKKELGIVLLNEDNEPVSSCIGYFDAVNADMEIEVVCTRKEDEGRGFAKLVIAECIKKGLKLGAKNFSISGWNDLTKHLYSSFGKSNRNQKVSLHKK